MALSRAKQIVIDLHSKVLITGKVDLIDQFVAKNMVFHTPYVTSPLKGRDNLSEFISAVYSSFSNLRITTNDLIAEGNRVAVRCTIQGHSIRDFMNIPAGGDHRIICVMLHYHLKKGKIIEAWAIDTSMWPQVFDF